MIYEVSYISPTELMFQLRQCGTGTRVGSRRGVKFIPVDCACPDSVAGHPPPCGRLEHPCYPLCAQPLYMQSGDVVDDT